MITCPKCQKKAVIYVWVIEFLGVDPDFGNRYHEYWCCVPCALKLGSQETKP